MIIDTGNKLLSPVSNIVTLSSVCVDFSLCLIPCHMSCFPFLPWRPPVNETQPQNVISCLFRQPIGCFLLGEGSLSAVYILYLFRSLLLALFAFGFKTTPHPGFVFIGN